jgi:4-amino-4-deoxy-L-arabinose transferase-like glycosyltransferase
MLVGFVMLSIYLIARWEQRQTVLSFVGAAVAVAGGMMTKGPIAVVVPVLAFVPHWISKKDWEKLYHPHYLVGIIVIAILLIPMSWGLYQQYDLHPGKLINGRPIQSGLKFYYWTQSFGRYTGENYYKEMGYFTFLLENMFWSFLPWIFTFLIAIVAKTISIVKEGFFKPSNERISFFGFVLTYIILARSQAQLPHYIFVVFPLASILCANFWQEQIINAKGFSRALNILWGLHLFVFSILIVVLLAIAFLPFGTISIVGILVIVALLMLLILIIKSAKSKGMKWWYMSIVIMIGVNTIMDTHFYPHLLQYQWGNSFAKTIDQKHWDKNKMVLYKMDNSNALHFYAQHVFPKIEDSTQLKSSDWVIIEQKNDSILLQQFPNSKLMYSGTFYHVTLLSLPFLNPSTRQGELQPYRVWELKN